MPPQPPPPSQQAQPRRQRSEEGSEGLPQRPRAGPGESCACADPAVGVAAARERGFQRHQPPEAVSSATVSTATALDPRLCSLRALAPCAPRRRARCSRNVDPAPFPRSPEPSPAARTLPYLVPEEGRVQQAQEPQEPHGAAAAPDPPRPAPRPPGLGCGPRPGPPCACAETGGRGQSAGPGRGSSRKGRGSPVRSGGARGGWGGSRDRGRGGAAGNPGIGERGADSLGPSGARVRVRPRWGVRTRRRLGARGGGEEARWGWGTRHATGNGGRGEPEAASPCGCGPLPADGHPAEAGNHPRISPAWRA